MAEAHVITALVEKYREISGKLVQSEKETKDLKQQLKTISATIRLYRADFKTAGILPKRIYTPNAYFKRGTFHRIVMDVLREANEPLSARELAIRALQRQGITPDKETADQFRRPLNAAFVKYAKVGRLLMLTDTFPKRWKIVR